MPVHKGPSLLNLVISMVIFKRPELGRIVKFIVFVSLFYSLESHSSDFSSTKLKELVSLRAEFNDLNRKLHSKQV